MSGNIVMVTGGSGFIGSHLVEALLPDNQVHVFDVVPLDDAVNLREVKRHPNLRYVQGDIRDRDAFRKFWISDADVIYHLASVVGIKNYIADPLKLIEIIIGGTRTLLELARDFGTKVLFASTSEIYGKNPSTPWDETSDRVLGPTSIDRWSYSSSKAVCEHMLYGAYRQWKVPFSIVRFFNVYGPRQNPYFVVSQSVYKVLRNEEPLLYDDGKSTRCFTYVDDIVEGTIEVARDARAIGEDFNLGNSSEVTMKQVVETIISESAASVKYRLFDTKAEYGAQYEDIPRRIPKVEKAERILGWKAKIQLVDGVRRTLDWAKMNRWWLSDRTI